MRLRHQLSALMLGACFLASSQGAPRDLLLIPDSGNDRIWAFDPFDGSLVNDNLIPGGGQLTQPINAINSGRGTILVSDETGDRVQEFNYNGSYVGLFADSSDGLDGPFGMTVYNSQVYVVSNVNDKIVRFELDGSNPVDWASVDGSPRDIVFRETDALVSDSGSEDILRYDLSGNLLAPPFHESDGVSGIDFPQQMQLEANGNVLAAGFSAPFGLYEYDSAGNEINAYTNLITSPRGVYRLGNGQLLYAGGTRVMRYDPNTLTEETVINQSGTSFRFIELAEVPEPATWPLVSLGLLGLVSRLRRKEAA